MTVGIYSILNKANGKIYVGQSVNIEKRVANHKSALKNNTHPNSHLQSSWNKHSFNSFEFNVLEKCSEDKLDENECWWIDYFDSMNRTKGYNHDSGGNARKHLSPQTIKKMSDSRKGDKHFMYGKYGEEHIRYGKTHSLESKLKMSYAHNSTGYYRVTKMSSKSCRQGFRWGYSYYENGKRKLISSTDINNLEKKVKDKGLDWFKLKEE